jgi:APA family basic amino acid/polyamine antiporter
VLLTATRAYYAMARDGLFFQHLADVHPGFGTPAVSIVASGLVAMVLAATGTFEQLFTYVIFSGWIFYSMGGAALFVLRAKEPDAHRPFRVPGYPITPALFVAAGTAVVLNAIVTQPRESAVGIAIVLVGAPAYLIWRRRAAELS